jgi:hypothetical protein
MLLVSLVSTIFGGLITEKSRKKQAAVELFYKRELLLRTTLRDSVKYVDRVSAGLYPSFIDCETSKYIVRRTGGYSRLTKSQSKILQIYPHPLHSLYLIYVAVSEKIS